MHFRLIRPPLPLHARQALPHRRPQYLQAVQLVVRFQQVDSLGFVVRKPHALGPVLAAGPGAVDGDDAVGGEDGGPEGVLVGVVWGGVGGCPV